MYVPFRVRCSRLQKFSKPLALPLATSEVVLTELFHLAGDSRHEMEAAWRLVALRRDHAGGDRGFGTPR